MNKKLIKKYLFGGPGYFVFNGNNRKAQSSNKRLSSNLARRGLKALERIGRAFIDIAGSGGYSDMGLTSPFTFSSGEERRRIQRSRVKATEKAKLKAAEASVYISPSSHVAAWTQGSLDPKVGALVISRQSPEVQLGAALFDIGTFAKGPKLIRKAPAAVDRTLARAGNKSAATRTVAREIDRAVDNTTLQSTTNSPEVTLAYVPTQLLSAPTSWRFYERRSSRISESERAGVPKVDRNNNQSFHIAYYPGYQLKGLMKGSQIERSVSKSGTINVNLLKTQFKKNSLIEQAIVDKVINEKFPGLKNINYNDFKKAVLDELIDYNKVHQTAYEDYGVRSLGYKTKEDQLQNVIYNEETGLFEQVAPFYEEEFNPDYTLNTFTFESPRIPYGSNKHYNKTTLGHLRTFVDKNDPHTLYILESLSDWGLSKIKMVPGVKTMLADIERAKKSGDKTAYQLFINRLQELHREYNSLKKNELKALENIDKALRGEASPGFNTIDELWNKKYLILDNASKRSDIGVQGLYLHDNYLRRQLQESMKHASENGHTKLRYPTAESAVKIEGYPRAEVPDLKDIADPETRMLFILLDPSLLTPYTESIVKLKRELRAAEKSGDATKINKTKSDLARAQKVEARWKAGEPTYSLEHESILDKYRDFPNLYKKLYKNSNLRSVTDSKGNTWYEIDVPKGYLNREWQYKFGGQMQKRLIKKR